MESHDIYKIEEKVIAVAYVALGVSILNLAVMVFFSLFVLRTAVG